MKDITKYALVTILGLLSFLFIMLTSSDPAEQSAVTQITQHIIAEGDEAMKIDLTPGINNIYAKQIRKRIKLTPPHDDYDWSWDIHIAYIWWMGTPDKIEKIVMLGLTIKHYECDSSGPFKNVLIEYMRDYQADGVLDDYHPWFLLISDEDSIWIPKFPKNFINPAWINRDKEETQKIYDEEIQFWLKQIENG